MAIVAAIAQVLAVEADLVLIEKTLQTMQEVFVQWRGSADRQGQTVTDKREALGQATELVAHEAADADPVLGCDFEKVHRRWCLEEFVEHAPPEAEPGSADRIVFRHDSRFRLPALR